MSPQPRLHMPYRNLVIKCRQRGSKCRSRISMYKHHIRFFSIQYIVKAMKDRPCHRIQRLSFFHNIQIIIRSNMKCIQNRIQHFSVLGRNTYDTVYLTFMPFHLLYDRSHLYSFRTGSENTHHLYHLFTFPVNIISISIIVIQRKCSSNPD